jgi:nuclear GTP-binding protein
LAAARTVLSDWNHHKIPFFSVPPTIHPSLLPSLTAQGDVAPGAEAVGQARILQEMAPAFSLPGFDFGGSDGMDVIEAADEGAFNDDGFVSDEMNVENYNATVMEMDEIE